MQLAGKRDHRGGGGGSSSTSAVPSIFAAAAADSSSNNEPDNSDEEEKRIAPIPLPSESSADPNAPLLDAMKRTRDDPTKFEEYVKSRPNELNPTDEAFERVPVEAFGRAMLEGMGYKEDKDDTVQP